MENSYSTRSSSNLWLYAILVCLALVAISAVFISLDIDRKFAHIFYVPPHRWALTDQWFWKLLNKYGTVPGILLSLGSLIGFLLSAIKGRYKEWERVFAVTLLTSVIGGGLVVNVLLKSYWGRPRPDQVAGLGGEWAYRDIYQLGIPGQGTSFPCGDATMGFLFITLAYAGRRSPVLSRAGFAFGLVYGAIIGFGRIGSGSHFPLDVIWSLGIMVLVSIACDYGVRERSRIWGAVKPLLWGRRKVLTTGFIIAAALLLLSHRPLYTTYRQGFTIPTDTEEIVIESNVDLEEVHILGTDTEQANVVIHAEGFGFPGIFHEWRGRGKQERRLYHIHSQIQVKGIFVRLKHTLVLYLPHLLSEKVRVNVIKNLSPFDYHARLPVPPQKGLTQVDFHRPSAPPDLVNPDGFEVLHRAKG